LITHYAELTGCDGGAEAANACRTDANWDNHSMMASMMYDEFSVEALNGGCKIMKGLRGNAKTIFLGLCYGMGGGKLCLSLGLEAIQVVKDPNVREWRTVLADSDEGRELQKQGQRPFLMAGEEGQALLNRFRMRVPYVGQLQRMAKAKANRVGYIKTLLGRRCRFPRHPQTGRLEWAHKALNRLIQGSAADQTKMAMVLADEAGVRMQLQVHDEIDLTIWDRKEAEVLNEIMVDAIKLNVPTRCDIETGPDWGSIS
jgi:DNA polymerase I-like protein with 3'-5' exonuclease and polymerase domains